jgi:hypothetical protein
MLSVNILPRILFDAVMDEKSSDGDAPRAAAPPLTFIAANFRSEVAPGPTTRMFRRSPNLHSK